jgi:hypothetical protein
VRPERPRYRPLERFWPYADLTEQPSEEELAAIHPDLRQALFGAPPSKFSITIVFRDPDGAYPRALKLARGANEYVVVGEGPQARHYARFFPGDRPRRIRDLYYLVADLPETEVLINDKAVPYARELWLPLVWLLIR